VKKFPVSFDNWRETTDAEKGAPVAGYDVYFIDETPKLINQSAREMPRSAWPICVLLHI
jgi:hypothetical protein